MPDSNKIIVSWLAVVCATIFTMIVVGGITRLTGSGLSMVEWRPIMGTLPPLNAAEWQLAFEAYQQYPQYQLENHHMDLAAFKSIFYWEYGHRLLGRLIGLIYFVPFVLLWASGQIKKPLVPKLLLGLALGGLQGLMGWYMVKSGLVDMPRVSHFRLAAHLLLALSIFAYLFWLILHLIEIKRESFVANGIKPLIYGFAVCLGLQLTWGAFTAGSHAGIGYNTFPLMNDQWIAEAVFSMEPWWLSLFESTATIQFVHRWLGALVLILVAIIWIRSLIGDSRQVRWAASMVFFATLVQFGLGVFTLIHIVPIGLASLHQAWACVLLLSAVYLVYVVRKPIESIDLVRATP
jgi:heme a synthase